MVYILEGGGKGGEKEGGREEGGRVREGGRERGEKPFIFVYRRQDWTCFVGATAAGSGQLPKLVGTLGPSCSQTLGHYHLLSHHSSLGDSVSSDYSWNRWLPDGNTMGREPLNKTEDTGGLSAAALDAAPSK